MCEGLSMWWFSVFTMALTLFAVSVVMRMYKDNNPNYDRDFIFNNYHYDLMLKIRDEYFYPPEKDESAHMIQLYRAGYVCVYNILPNFGTVYKLTEDGSKKMMEYAERMGGSNESRK